MPKLPIAKSSVKLPTLSPLQIGVVSGVGLAVLLWLCFGMISTLNGTKTLHALEENLAAEMVEFPLSDEEFEALAATPSKHEASALLPAPIDGLYEEGRLGKMPIISANHLTPFDGYKKTFARDKDKTPIALVVKDYGMNTALSQRALTLLPPVFSVMISPYAPDAQGHLDAARAAGHEVWLHIPSENEDYPSDDPGPKGLLSQSGLQYNRDNLEWALSRMHGYTGVAAHIDHAFDHAHTMLSGLLQGTFARGLGYFEMNTRSDGFSEKKALASGAAFEKNMSSQYRTLPAPRDVVQDLTLKAEQLGGAAAVITLTPAFLDQAEALIAEAEGQGFEFTPLSVLADE
ncbi:MAG: divergent polysaccharide deacetylase family protein [Alphaproteobacteria bacterium]